MAHARPARTPRSTGAWGELVDGHGSRRCYAVRPNPGVGLAAKTRRSQPCGSFSTTARAEQVLGGGAGGSWSTPRLSNPSEIPRGRRTDRRGAGTSMGSSSVPFEELPDQASRGNAEVQPASGLRRARPITLAGHGTLARCVQHGDRPPGRACLLGAVGEYAERAGPAGRPRSQRGWTGPGTAGCRRFTGGHHRCPSARLLPQQVRRGVRGPLVGS